MLPRSLIRRSVIHQLRRPYNHRWTHTSQPSSGRRYFWTHLLAGVTGGLVVIGAGEPFNHVEPLAHTDLKKIRTPAGYTYYHFSGLKRVVDASKQLRGYLEQTKQSVVNKHPNEALNYLRQLVKSYVAVVPGSGFAVDKLFDSVGEVIEEHHKEASEILAKAQAEVEGIVKQKDQLTNTELAARIMAVIGKHMNEIGKLGAKAGGPLFQPVIDRLPEKFYFTEKVDQSVGMLKTFFEKGKGKD
ncbi:hypothetical protein F5050DRAFT_400607 [Lentinula boryana]|uniref:DUF5667 domain-containing protein n=1 Tax=Lentinula boryana TaxID=40481 RepID=A0ABQ8QQB9_9AGAR|nr:hypothetical protein F5050DRAFT_400607 [Lentinula boryana]